jgi:hypothetical protein
VKNYNKPCNAGNNVYESYMSAVMYGNMKYRNGNDFYPIKCRQARE